MSTASVAAVCFVLAAAALILAVIRFYTRRGKARAGPVLRRLTAAESERHFRELANDLPEIVWIATAEGKPEYFNQQWFQYSGGPTTGENLPVDWTAVTHPDDRPKYMEAWEQSVRTGTPFNIEHRLRRASDGAERWHLGRAVPIRDENGQILRWFGTSTDIDDQKRAEAGVRQINVELEQRVLERTEKLTAANEELARANQAKNRFLATMSHELRTPLNAIVGFTGTLLMKLPGPLNSDQENQLKIVRSSANHLLSLINDLLDLASIEAGKLVLDLQPVIFQLVLSDVARTLGPLAAAKGLRLEVIAPDGDLVVPADARALNQIILNLANNAIKFTDKGFVRLEIKRAARAGEVEFSVTDSGIGIKADDQERLFRAFERVHDSTRSFEGTGLGLHLSQQMASLHGGTIVCESTFGSGSRFSLFMNCESRP